VENVEGEYKKIIQELVFGNFAQSCKTLRRKAPRINKKLKKN
jgi:hypothetical protein